MRQVLRVLSEYRWPIYIAGHLLMSIGACGALVYVGGRRIDSGAMEMGACSPEVRVDTIADRAGIEFILRLRLERRDHGLQHRRPRQRFSERDGAGRLAMPGPGPESRAGMCCDAPLAGDEADLPRFPVEIGRAHV